MITDLLVCDYYILLLYAYIYIMYIYIYVCDIIYMCVCVHGGFHKWRYLKTDGW